MLDTSILRLSDDLLDSTESREVISFRDYVDSVNPRYRWYRHHEAVAACLQDVADGKINRLMILMPRRHGKTELASRLFPAYYLHRHPSRFVGLASYGQQVASPMSKAARMNFVRGGGDLDPAMRQVKEWHTMHGGGMWAVGRGGSLTGRGWNLGIADDTIKDDKEARSNDIKEGMREWWGSVFYTGAEPPEQLVLVNTTWADDDLSGWRLTEEEEEIKLGAFGEPERWHVVCLPAIMPAPKHRRTFPATCTVERDWRKTGDALWPEKYPLKRLLQIRKNAKSWFDPLYQQNPVPLDGGIITRKMLSDVRPMSSAPPMLRRIAFVDLAVSEKDTADLTVCFVVGLGIDGRFYIYPPYYGQYESPETVVGCANLCKKYKAQMLGYEDVAYQRSFGQQMRKFIKGKPAYATLSIVDVRVDRDKLARARAWTPAARDAGMVLLDDGSGWVEDMVPMMVRFPKHRYKDPVDALGGAMKMHSELGGGMNALAGGKKNDPLSPHSR